MELGELVTLVGRLRATTKKTEKVALIAGLLQQARKREIELLALYLTGTLAQGRIGIGHRGLAGRDAVWARRGGATHARGPRRGARGARAEQGQGSAERRARGLRALLERAEPAGRQFLFELLTGQLRQGALEGLVLEAIAKASALPAAEVRQASMFAPTIGALARAALDEGGAGLARFSLQLLSPVAPMLANPAGDAEEALERLGEAAFEYKLDGARLQVHRAGDEVRVFTRHLQDVTARVPEVVEWARALPVREAVVEGEALALRPDGRPRPFQETMRRLGRKLDVAAARAQRPALVLLLRLPLPRG